MLLLEYIVLLLLLFFLLILYTFMREYLRKRAFILALKVLKIQPGDVVLIESTPEKLDEDEMAELYRLAYQLQRNRDGVIVVRLAKGYDIKAIPPEYMRLYGWVRAEPEPVPHLTPEHSLN